MTANEIERKLREIGISNATEYAIEVNSNPKHLKINFEIWLENDVFGEDCNEFKEFYSKNGVFNWNYINTNTKKEGILVFVYNDKELKVINDANISDSPFLLGLRFALEKYLNKIYDML